MEHPTICEGVALFIVSIRIVIDVLSSLSALCADIYIERLNPIECIPVILIAPIDNLRQAEISARVKANRIRVHVGH